MLITSITAFIALRKLTIVVSEGDAEGAETTSAPAEDSESTDENVYSPEHYVILKRTGM